MYDYVIVFSCLTIKQFVILKDSILLKCVNQIETFITSEIII
jgi:hypothetical protein